MLESAIALSSFRLYSKNTICDGLPACNNRSVQSSMGNVIVALKRRKLRKHRIVGSAKALLHWREVGQAG